MRTFTVRVNKRTFTVRPPKRKLTADDTNRTEYPLPTGASWTTWGQTDIRLSDITQTFGELP